MGADAGGFGQAVAQSMGTALKEGRSAAKGLQAGFEGAIGYTQKKVGAPMLSMLCSSRLIRSSSLSMLSSSPKSRPKGEAD